MKSAYDSETHIPDWAKDRTDDEKVSSSFQAIDIEDRAQVLGTVLQRHNSDESEDDIECRCQKVDPVLCLFRLFHASATLVIVSTVISNCLILSKPPFTEIRDTAIRVFTVTFSLVLIFVEMDVRYVVRRAKFLQNWVLRGSFYAFLGFCTGNKWHNEQCALSNIHRQSETMVP